MFTQILTLKVRHIQ